MPAASNWLKLDPYCLRQKFSPKNLVLALHDDYGDIRRDYGERMR